MTPNEVDKFLNDLRRDWDDYDKLNKLIQLESVVTNMRGNINVSISGEMLQNLCLLYGFDSPQDAINYKASLDHLK